MSGKVKEETKSTRQASLIPVVERQEEQLRAELEQVRRQSDEQIRHALEQAQQQIQQSRLNVAQLVEDKRKEGLAELQKQAQRITQSLEQSRSRLQQQARNNMGQAVRRLVDAVLGTANGVTTAGDQT